MSAADDLTLDELREALASMLPDEVAFDGWTDVALYAAARSLGVPPPRARLAFPDGAIDMIDAWFAGIDREMARRLPSATMRSLRIRARIAALVEARLDALAPHREALRRALAILASPRHGAAAARLGWRAADVMWRIAGDDATGFAHYSKRLTLAGVYGTTLLTFVQDESQDQVETRAFLARRIDDVMRFERIKANLRPDPERHFNVARFLGRLRYPVR